jgi:hypothetical protein
VLSKPPVEHHLTGKLWVSAPSNQLLVEVSHQRLAVRRGIRLWDNVLSTNAGFGSSNVVVVDANNFFAVLFFDEIDFSTPELVFPVGAGLYPVPISSAIFTLDKGTVLDVVAENFALETLDAFGTGAYPVSNFVTLLAQS